MSSNCRKVTIGALLLLTVGCGGYGEVSPTAYEYAKALYAISNRQASANLDGVEQQIDQAESVEQLTTQEAAWLTDIIADCRAGEWQTAQKAARRMMQDQVKHP